MYYDPTAGNLNNILSVLAQNFGRSSGADFNNGMTQHQIADVLKKEGLVGFANTSHLGCTQTEIIRLITSGDIIDTGNCAYAITDSGFQRLARDGAPSPVSAI